MNIESIYSLKAIIDKFENSLTDFYQRDVLVQCTLSTLDCLKGVIFNDVSSTTEDTLSILISELSNMGCKTIHYSYREKLLILSINHVTYDIQLDDEDQIDGNVVIADKTVATFPFKQGVFRIVSEILFNILLQNYDTICFNPDEYIYIRKQLVS